MVPLPLSEISPPRMAITPGCTANAQPPRRADSERALGAAIAPMDTQVEPNRYLPSLRSAESSRPPQTTKCEPSQTPNALERALRLLLNVDQLSVLVVYENTLSWRVPLIIPPRKYTIEP